MSDNAWYHTAMGYDLRFEGRFEIAPPLSPDRLRYLAAFTKTWRRPRDVSKLSPAARELREAVGFPLGREASFHVGGASHTEDDRGDASVLSFDRAPDGQPGMRCCWRPTSDGAALEWDGCEKFGSYAEWLSYLNQTFLEPWGHSLSGTVRWIGEDGAEGSLRASATGVVDQPDEPEVALDEEIKTWIDCLRTGDLDMRIVAATELGCAVGADAESRSAAIAALLEALDPPALAKAALETLGEFGEEAGAGSVEVARMLEHADPQVRYWATYALGRMGGRK